MTLQRSVPSGADLFLYNSLMEQAANNQRIFSKDFFLLFVTNFISCSIYFLLITMSAGYAIAMFSCSEALAGWAASIFMLGATGGRLISGHVSTHLSRKTAIICVLVMLGACVAYSFTSVSYLLLLLVRTVHGIAYGIAQTLLQILATRSMPPHRLGEGMGYYTLSITLATALGPMMGLLVVNGFDYNLLFMGCTIAAVIGLATLLFVTKDAQPEASIQTAPVDEPSSQKRFSIFILIDKGTWKFSVFMLVFGASYGPFNAFIAPYAADLDMAVYAPFVFLVYAFVLLFSRPLAGMLQDRKGDAFVLAPSMAFMAIGMVICAMANNPIMLLSVGIFMALGFGTGFSCAQAAITRMTLNTGTTSMAVSTLFLFVDFGNAIGPILVGAIAAATDYRIMWLACAALAAISLVYFLYVKSRAQNVAE